MGDVSNALGQYAVAAEHYQAALDLYTAVGHQLGRADAQRGLGEVAIAMGNRTAATERFTMARNIYRHVGSRHRMAFVLFELGRLETNPYRAKLLLSEAAAIFDLIRDPFGDKVRAAIATIEPDPMDG